MVVKPALKTAQSLGIMGHQCFPPPDPRQVQKAVTEEPIDPVSSGVSEKALCSHGWWFS